MTSLVNQISVKGICLTLKSLLKQNGARVSIRVHQNTVEKSTAVRGEDLYGNTVCLPQHNTEKKIIIIINNNNNNNISIWASFIVFPFRRTLPKKIG